MIGNTIIFRQYGKTSSGFRDYDKVKEVEGLVVDAWTDVSGSVKGESLFGFGDVKGDTQSRRMYKVEYQMYEGGSKYYEDIEDYLLIRVVKLAKVVMFDEKIIMN